MKVIIVQLLWLLAILASIINVHGIHDKNQPARGDFHWKQKFGGHGNRIYEHPNKFDEGEEFAEELIRFFEMGDAEIELLDDVKDVILIVGASGVGKSTLGYIVTEDKSNPLSVQCDDIGICNIVDEKGHIGNDTLISKTLLPNLILEETMEPNTAFYDCPGFFDNRNASVEIANSYFMNKVALHARRLKIFIVTLFTDYDNSYRSRILDLLKQIVQLFPTIHTYAESVFMIANRLPNFQLTEEQIYLQTTRFLNLVLVALSGGELEDWSDDEVMKASSLINSLIGSGFEDNKLWYFTTPDKLISGPIEEFPRIMASKNYIRDLIWNKTDYYENPRPEDFGFPLTDKALNNLQSAATTLAMQILELMNEAFKITLTDLHKISNDCLVDQYNQFNYFVQSGINIVGSHYGRFNEYNSNISAFAAAVVETSRTFMSATVETDLNRVITSAGYLTFINNIKDYSIVTNPDAWVSNFELLKFELSNMVDGLSEHFDSSIKSAASSGTQVFLPYINNLIQEFNETDIPSINILNNILNKMFTSKFKTLNDDEIGGDVSSLMMNNQEIIQVFTNGRIDQYLDSMVAHANRLQFLQSVNSTIQNIYTEKWVEPFVEMATEVKGEVTQKITPLVIQSAYNKVTEFTRLMFASIKLKIEKNDSIEDMINVTSEIQSNTTLAKAVIESSLHEGPGFLDFIGVYVQQFKQIDNSLTEDDLKEVTSIYASIALIEHVDTIKFETGYNWREPMIKLEATLKAQQDYFNFLLLLYKGLSSASIHVNKNGDLLYWRTMNQVINTSNFRKLCDQLRLADVSIGTPEQIEVILGHLLENELDLDLLNTLLDYTIGVELSPRDCPRVYNGALMFDTTNYITMSYVVGCLNVSPFPSHIVILGQEQVFMDSPLEIKKFPVTAPVTFFLMGMTMDVQQATIDLGGADGAPPSPAKIPGKNGEAGLEGEIGQAASNFISIYGKRNSDPPVTNSGGAGGQGQGGSDGQDGNNGAGKRFTSSNDVIPESECAAWSGGDINVRIYPNSCNSGSSTCHAGNDGVWVTLYGGTGDPGRPGGNGGAGGPGGQGGFVYKLDVYSGSSGTTTYGANGQTGLAGAKGIQGSPGSPGRDNRYRIDDEGAPKRCKIKERQENFDINYVNIQKNATVEKKGSNYITPYNTLTVTSKSFDIGPFQPYIDEFLRNARRNVNVFNRVELNKFISAVESNANLNTN